MCTRSHLGSAHAPRAGRRGRRGRRAPPMSCAGGMSANGTSSVSISQNTTPRLHTSAFSAAARAEGREGTGKGKRVRACEGGALQGVPADVPAKARRLPRLRAARAARSQAARACEPRHAARRTGDVGVVHDHLWGHVGQRAAQVVHVGAEGVVLVLGQAKVGLADRGGGVGGQCEGWHRQGMQAQQQAPACHQTNKAEQSGARGWDQQVGRRAGGPHHFDHGAALAGPVAVHQQVVGLDVKVDHLRGGSTGWGAGRAAGGVAAPASGAGGAARTRGRLWRTARLCARRPAPAPAPARHAP